MPFCYFGGFDFSNLRMTLVKKLSGTETKNNNKQLFTD